MLFLANIAGFVAAKWRGILLVIAGVFAVIVLFSAGARIYRWFNPPPKFNEPEIKKSQDAIAKAEREKMIEVLAENDVREQGLDDTLLGAANATENAKKNYDGLSNEEIAAEHERRAKGE